jgi:hypothetical protein
MPMNLREIIREMHYLAEQLREFEDKYGILSHDFYDAMESGELSELDGEPDYHKDFLTWHGLYKAWLYREQRYQELSKQRRIVEQIHTGMALEPA